MLTTIRTDSTNTDFVALVACLDADLAERDGAEHAFYAPLNSIKKIRHVIVAYAGNVAVGCGALREHEPGVMEVKRMYTRPEHRGRGIASRVLGDLEAWAAEMSYSKCILETGKRQPEALALYAKNGYRRIPNFGQYTGKDNSVCFEKSLPEAAR
jgi:putative acetyltransferase